MNTPKGDFTHADHADPKTDGPTVEQHPVVSLTNAGGRNRSARREAPPVRRGLRTVRPAGSHGRVPLVRQRLSAARPAARNRFTRRRSQSTMARRSPDTSAATPPPSMPVNKPRPNRSRRPSPSAANADAAARTIPPHRPRTPPGCNGSSTAICGRIWPICPRFATGAARRTAGARWSAGGATSCIWT